MYSKQLNIGIHVVVALFNNRTEIRSCNLDICKQKIAIRSVYFQHKLMWITATVCNRWAYRNLKSGPCSVQTGILDNDDRGQ